MNPFLSFIAARLPRATRHRLKKLYYPHVLRRFPEDRWPPARAVRALVQHGDQVVDAGANIGYVTALLSRWIGPQGRVYSFEPVPETFDLLRHNVQRLGLANVSAFNLGLSDAGRPAMMAIPEYASGAENLYESRLVSDDTAAGMPWRPVAVSLRDLDSVLRDVPGPVTLMKVDVEGHELPVVRGARQLIDRSKPALLIEVGGDPKAPGSAASELFQMLASSGYTPWVCDARSFMVKPCGERSTDYFFLQAGHLTKLGQAGILSGHGPTP